jgi:hypothetical protein
MLSTIVAVLGGIGVMNLHNVYRLLEKSNWQLPLSIPPALVLSFFWASAASATICLTIVVAAFTKLVKERRG